jgi:hypothetical protein
LGDFAVVDLGFLVWALAESLIFSEFHWTLRSWLAGPRFGSHIWNLVASPCGYLRLSHNMMVSGSQVSVKADF